MITTYVKSQRALGVAILTLCFCSQIMAGELDEAVPKGGDVLEFAPLFDFDGDVCYPAPAINKQGNINPGVEIDNRSSSTFGCRDEDEDLESANTYHRGVCASNENGNILCAHTYALYFEKDEISSIVSIGDVGHKHDWEYVVIWTTDGTITHASASVHGDIETKAIKDIEVDDKHVKFVSHKGRIVDESTASMRFADRDEDAENPKGWYTPTVVDWFQMTGDDTVTNKLLRERLTDYDFVRAHFPLSDNGFVGWFTDAESVESCFTVGMIVRCQNSTSDAIPDGYGDQEFWNNAVAADLHARAGQAEHVEKQHLPKTLDEQVECLDNRESRIILTNSRTTLNWQTDGNLVMYIRENQTPLWSSETRNNGTDLCFQGDGNLVIYNNGNPTWATNDRGNSLRLGQDCDLALYQDSERVWSTGTSCDNASENEINTPDMPLLVLAEGALTTVSFSSRKELLASTHPNGWQPHSVFFGFESGDGGSLDGLRVVDVDGNNHDLNGWWLTIEKPFDPDGVGLLIPGGQGDRKLNIRWWYQ